jgi:predicted phosphoadenosine phosphosulfate sulfurtransferase
MDARTFSRICVSFSGGKDSTVMLHLTAQMAREKRKIACSLLTGKHSFPAPLAC